MNEETPTPPAVLRTFAMLLVLLALAALDQTIVSTALPSIARDLQGTSHMSWVFSAYLIASTVAVPLYGRLADQHGSKPVLLMAVALFLVGSLLCGVSQDMVSLIAARGLQGAGGGGFLTLAMTSVVRMFTPAPRARLQGLLGAAYGLSTMAGPVVGGLMVEHLSWRWAFFVNLPIGLVALVVLALNQPRLKPEHKGAMDYSGAVLLSAALVCLMLATGRGMLTIGSPAAFALIGGALAIGFIWSQRRAADPLLPLALFRQSAFSAAAALSATSGVMLFAVVVFLPLYFQSARGLAPADSGWHLMPLMAGITVASIGCGRILSATGKVRVIATTACALVAASFIALGFSVAAPAVPVGWVSACLVPLGIGLGASFPLVTVVAQRSAPMRLLGIATASPVMFRSVAGAIGVSVLATLLTEATAHLGAAGVAREAIFGAGLAWVFWATAGVALVGALATSALPIRLTARPDGS